MKRIIIPALTLLLLSFLLPMRAEASHNMGIDLTYECINNCTIRVHLRAYRDCSGISTIPNTITFTGQGVGCNIPPSPVTGWSVRQTTEVTPVCPGTVTKCTNSSATLNGVQEYYWWRDYNICNASANCLFTISWSDCCRNSAVTSGATGGIYIGSTTINTGLATCNSSPQFSNPPVPYICAGQTFTFNQGATDPDGDSLVYSLGPCMSANGTQVTYNAGYSAAQPLGASWNVSINSTNGDITVVPQPGNQVVGVMCVYVDEYRNGVLINTIVRDIQMTVIPCPSNATPQITGLSNLSGATQTDSFTVQLCAGGQVCFDIIPTDANGDSLTMFWNQNIPGATFTQTGNPGVQDTIRGYNISGTFCFNPVANGTYTFLVTVQDDACPVFGNNQYTFNIIVGQVGLNPNIQIVGCTDVSLCVSPTSGNAPYTFLWSGQGGLSSNPNVTDSCLSHIYPDTGSYAFSVTVMDSGGCQGIYSDTIHLINNTTAFAGPDTSYCSGNPVQIGGPSTPDETYSWTPQSGLSNPNISNPVVNMVNNGNTPIVMTYILDVNNAVTGCSDADTVQVTINPSPTSTFNAPNFICDVATANITYTGNMGPGATYNWNFGVDANPASANTQGPHAVTYSSTGWKYITLEVSANGCTSAVTIDSIEVYQSPVADIDPVVNQCLAGNTFNFSQTGSTFGGTANFNWGFGPGANPFSSTAQNPANVVFTTPGSKFATLQINDRGCVSNRDSIFFEVYPQPDPSFIAVGGGVQCFSQHSYDFITQGNNGTTASYQWTFDPDGIPANTTTQNPTGVTFQNPGQKLITLTVEENGCIETQTQVVDVMENPIVNAPLPASFCEGEGGVVLYGSASNGTSPYYYTWWCDSSNTYCGIDSVNSSSPNVNPTSSTMYYVQVTDFNGCTSNIDSVFVTVHPKPIVNAGPDVWICPDSAPCVPLNAQVINDTIAPGPYSWQWTPATGLNNPNISNPCARPDTTTIYTVVVTDGNGCSSASTTIDTNATITVHVKPLPVANAGADIDICFGDTVMLQGIGYNAGPAYNYEWSPGNSLSDSTKPNPLAFPALTTEYILTVWSNGCHSYGDTMIVNVHDIPTVDAGPDRDICLDGMALMDGSVSGAPNDSSFSYLWWPQTGITGSNNTEDINVSPDTTTMYYFQAVSNWGCESSIDSALLTVRPTPVAEAGPDMTICGPDSILLNGSWYITTTAPVPDTTEIQYTWTPGSLVKDPTVKQTWAYPTTSTWFYFTVDYQICSTTDSVLVTVFPDLGLTVDADTTTICSGDDVQLYSQGGLGSALFEWTPSASLDDAGSQNPVASPTTTTTYMLVASEGGCTDTAEITINVLPTPEMAFLSSQPEGCAPLTVNFLESSTNTIQYIWNFGDGSPVVNTLNPSHTFTEPGTYEVYLSGISTGGCSDTSMPVTVIVHDTANAAFSSNPGMPGELSLPNTQVQFEDNSTNAASWHWDFGDGASSTEPDPSHTYSQAGTYYVTLTVTNDQGCISRVTNGPFMVVTPDLQIPNVFTPDGNGQNDEFSVFYTGSQPFSMQIFDRWGNLMFETNNKTEGWDGNAASGNAAPEGIYFYTVKIGKKSYAGNVTLMR